MKNNIQVSLIMCRDCYFEQEEVTLLRKSHANSYWCEHSEKNDDWHPGHQPPLLITMRKS